MYFLDLLGTFAFAVTGAYKAKVKKLNIFGVIILGVITAVGGGTFRDLIIGRTPLFYLKDPDYFLVGILAGILTYIMPTFFEKRYSFFRFMDSVGLATFLVIGVSVAENHLFGQQNFITLNSLLVCTFAGMVSGFGGGVIRDAIMGEEPYALKKGSNYVFASFCGSALFYSLSFVDVYLAVVASIAATIYLREIFSEFGLYKRIYVRILKNKSSVK